MPRDALIDNLIGMCAFVGRAQEFPCGQTVRSRAEYCTVCEAAEQLREQAQARPEIETQLRQDERERTLRTLASATRKVLSPELVKLVEAEMRRGLAKQVADECGNWTPLKAAEAAAPPRERGEPDRSQPVEEPRSDRPEPIRRDLAVLLDKLYGLHLRPGHIDAVLDLFRLHSPIKVPLPASPRERGEPSRQCQAPTLIPERDDER